MSLDHPGGCWEIAAVVDNDQLPIGKRLPQNILYRPVQGNGPIPGAGDDCNSGIFGSQRITYIAELTRPRAE
jgi:hypothetical protein